MGWRRAAALASCVAVRCAVADVAQDLHVQEAWSPEDVAREARRLRREADALDDQLVRWATPESFDIRAVLVATEDQRLAAAELQTQVASLRRAAALAGGELRGAAPEVADHGRTLFATLCAGSDFFDGFCGPFLASFERAYGAGAFRHRVVVFYANVDVELVTLASERFAPWCRFVSLGGAGEVYSGSADPDAGSFVCEALDGGRVCHVLNEDAASRKTQVDFRDTLLQEGIVNYLEEKEGDFCYVMFVDSDTLFVKPLGKYLPPCDARGGASGVDWDVALTTYDQGFVVPWSSSVSDVARTTSGYMRINGGVVVVSLRHTEVARTFLMTWAAVAVLIESRGEKEAFGFSWPEKAREIWSTWHDVLNEEFRGASQASLVLMLASYDVDRLPRLLGWDSCQVCHGPVEANIALSKEPLMATIRGFPARELNHAESMPEGPGFAEELCIVHLKGFWWRQVVLKHAYIVSDHFRRSSWNRDAIYLHRQASAVWRRALPEPLLQRVEREFRREVRFASGPEA